MPTLYVENVPEEVYEALRRHARQHRKSISLEVLSLLEENFPTTEELKRRQQLLKKLEGLRSHKPQHAGPFLTAEEMQRQDRDR